jgi:hypothetical protein
MEDHVPSSIKDEAAYLGFPMGHDRSSLIVIVIQERLTVYPLLVVDRELPFFEDSFFENSLFLVK